MRRAQRYQSTELIESGSKSKTCNRNHRDRQKLYVKSMEDEVLRLHEEWAAVLQGIERATEENLILKDILRSHPLSISSPTSSQMAPSSRSTSFSKTMNETESNDNAVSDLQGYSRNISNTFQHSPSNSVTASTPSSNLTGSVHTNTPCFGDPDAFGFFLTPSTLHPHPPHSETSETYGFFPSPSTSNQSPGEQVQLQDGTGKEMDGRSFSISSTMSCSHANVPDTEHYVDIERHCVNLDPCLTSNDSIQSLEQRHQKPRQDDHSFTEPPAYFDIAGIAPLGDAWNLTLPSRQLYDLHSDIDQSLLPDADPTSARRDDVPKSQLHHPEQLRATDWWEEMA